MRSIKNVVIGLLCGFVATFLLWILRGDTSPLVSQFAPHSVPLSELWVKLHYHFVILMIVFNIREEGSHIFFYSAIITQWFLIGWIASLIRSRNYEQSRLL